MLAELNLGIAHLSGLTAKKKIADGILPTGNHDGDGDESEED